MIELDHVTKLYPTVGGYRRVLDDVSFTVNRGESIGIMGRNGAGKTTLTRLISGAERPTSGTVRSTMSISWPLGMGGGFQSSLTGIDNIKFIARIYGLSMDGLVETVDDFAELGTYLRMPVKTYSSGMKARLAFAISLLLKFDCYLIDEVTSVGDGRFQQRCEEALLQRRNTGALIMISHVPSVLRTYCDRAALLHDGKLTFYDDLEEGLAAYQALFQ